MKRPPRKVWYRWHETRGLVSGPFLTKHEADASPTYKRGERTVGPYVLAERVREK